MDKNLFRYAAIATILGTIIGAIALLVSLAGGSTSETPSPSPSISDTKTPPQVSPSPPTTMQETTESPTLEPTVTPTQEATATTIPIDTLEPTLPDPTATQLPDPTEILPPGGAVSDSVAKDSFNDYSFQGNENTPLLFTIQRSQGDLGYWYQVFDSNGFQLAQNGTYYSGVTQIPFTPQEDGNYVFRILGTRAFGEYTLVMTYLGGEPESRNIITPAEIDTGNSGSLAVGAFDDYSFSGSANTPLLFSVQRVDGNLGYWYEFFDSRGTSLAENGTYYSGIATIPFTPQEDDDYIFRIIGTRDFGSYNLVSSYISGPPEQRNNQSVLEIDSGSSGSLAVGSYDEYLFDGVSNRPVVFTIQRSEGNLGYWYEIVSPGGDVVETNGTYYSGTAEISYSPPQDGTYIFRILGTRDFGSYVLVMREL